MKTLVAALVLLTAACQSTPSVYSVNARVEPWETQGMFLTVVDVEKTLDDGTQTLLAFPRVILEAGESAEMAIADHDETPSVLVTVELPEMDQLADGATIHTVVFENGAEVTNSLLRVEIPRPGAKEAPISFSFVRQDVLDVVTHLASRSGANIIVPPELRGEVTLAADGISACTALALALQPLGFAIEEEGDVMTIVAAEASAHAPIGVHFRRTDVREAIETIVAHGGGNIIVSPEVRGSVSLGVEGISWELALEAVAEAVGCAVDFGTLSGVARVALAPRD